MKIRCFLFVALFVALGGAENTFADGVRTLDFEGTQPGRLQKLWNSVTSPLSPIPTTTLATPDLKVFAKEPGFKYLGVTDDRVGDTLFSRIYKFQTNEGIFTFHKYYNGANHDFVFQRELGGRGTMDSPAARRLKGALITQQKLVGPPQEEVGVLKRLAQRSGIVCGGGARRLLSTECKSLLARHNRLKASISQGFNSGVLQETAKVISRPFPQEFQSEAGRRSFNEIGHASRLSQKASANMMEVPVRGSSARAQSQPYKVAEFVGKKYAELNMRSQPLIEKVKSPFEFFDYAAKGKTFRSTANIAKMDRIGYEAGRAFNGASKLVAPVTDPLAAGWKSYTGLRSGMQATHLANQAGRIASNQAAWNAFKASPASIKNIASLGETAGARLSAKAGNAVRGYYMSNFGMAMTAHNAIQYIKGSNECKKKMEEQGDYDAKLCEQHHALDIALGAGTTRLAVDTYTKHHKNCQEDDKSFCSIRAGWNTGGSTVTAVKEGTKKCFREKGIVSCPVGFAWDMAKGIVSGFADSLRYVGKSAKDSVVDFSRCNFGSDETKRDCEVKKQSREKNYAAAVAKKAQKIEELEAIKEAQRRAERLSNK